MKSRIHLVPFDVTIPRENRDPQLPEKLRAEWSGILSWMIEGAVEWRESGLQPPPAVVEATDNYFSDEDVIGKWIEDCCRVADYAKASIGDLFDSWEKWRTENGEREVTKRALGDRLEEKGFRREKGGKGRRLHVGIGLEADTVNN